MIRIVLSLLLALAIAGPLAGCGKKGRPQLPPGKSDHFPSKYPSS